MCSMLVGRAGGEMPDEILRLLQLVDTGRVWHSIEEHNAEIRSKGYCEYCDKGSIMVPKSLIEIEIQNV